MRIIAGKYRGRKLKEFKGYDVRPTSDRAREALFNILGNISGDGFLDLFCGTGAIGLEAASRGAGRVTLVDASEESVKLAKENAAILGADVTVAKADAAAFIGRTYEKFDYIFLDPPYAFDASPVIGAITKSGALNVGGLIIYEHSGESKAAANGLKLIDSRRYGVATFDFYEVEQ